MTTDSGGNSLATDPLRRAAVAGWLGTWTLIGVSFWLSFTRRRLTGITMGTRLERQWEPLLTDDFGVSVRELLHSLEGQLLLLGFLTAALAMILADRMQKVGPRWLGWLAGVGAVLALGSAYWEPMMFS